MERRPAFSCTNTSVWLQKRSCYLEAQGPRGPRARAAAEFLSRPPPHLFLISRSAGSRIPVFGNESTGQFSAALRLVSEILSRAGLGWAGAGWRRGLEAWRPGGVLPSGPWRSPLQAPQTTAHLVPGPENIHVVVVGGWARGGGCPEPPRAAGERVPWAGLPHAVGTLKDCQKGHEALAVSGVHRLPEVLPAGEPPTRVSTGGAGPCLGFRVCPHHPAQSAQQVLNAQRNFE